MQHWEEECWQLSDLLIDVGGQRLTRNGQALALPQLSFKFLLALVRAAPNILSIDDLMDEVWHGLFVNGETVTQRAKLLRDALGDDPKCPHYFTARRGAGYQLISLPKRIPASEMAAAIAPPRRIERLKLALGTALLAVAAIAGIAGVTGWAGLHMAAAKPVRVAVLPFDNFSSDPADAYIARTIPEMVLNRLSSINGLTVIARDSALLSPASLSSPADAGARLNADLVIKGSFQRDGSVLRVTCFVIDRHSDVRLWSERFDWPIDRLYALQDRIADRVASSLQSRVDGLGDLPQSTPGTRNPDAFLAYLKGEALLGRFSVAETNAAADQFERAVRLDPRFAPALVALFDARMQGADLRKDNFAVFRTRYQPLLNRAMTIDPNSGSALFVMAMWSDLPREERLSIFRRAAARDPSNTRGLTAYAEFLEKKASPSPGTFSKEGQPLLDHVLAIDPLNPRARFWAVGRQLGRLGSAQALEAEWARLLQIDPKFYPVVVRHARYRWMVDGETAEAIERIERVIADDPQNPAGPHAAAAFYLDADDPQAARAVAATTAASHDSTQALFAQYAGDWRAAGQAALGPRGFLFNQFENWNWSEAVRDQALHSREYAPAIRAIAGHYGIDPANPRITYLAQIHAAPSLAHLLLAKGDKIAANRLAAQTVRWIDAHYSSYGPTGLMRYRALSMMLLGDKDRALSDLRASMVTAHDIRHWRYETDMEPIWNPVRSDSRFKQIAVMCRQAAAVQRARLDALRRAGKVPIRV